MWYSLGTFIISSTILFVFLGLRIRMLRRGKLTELQIYTNVYKPTSITEMEELVRRAFRTGGRLAILYTLKYSVYGMRLVKQQIDTGVAKISRFAAHHEKKIVAAHKEDSASGRFLETISEYKSKLDRPKKRNRSVKTSI